MGLIKVHHKGNFNHTERFFNRVLKRNYLNILARYGAQGVEILKEATPVSSGETRDAWDYEIFEENGAVTIAWTNSHENKGVNVALMIIYGHGLSNGGYVQGDDFANPAIKPLMQEMANNAWREVTK